MDIKELEELEELKVHLARTKKCLVPLRLVPKLKLYISKIEKRIQEAIRSI